MEGCLAAARMRRTRSDMWWRERERERERDENRAYRENTEVRTECYSEIIELHVLSCCVDTPRAWSERAWRVRGAYYYGAASVDSTPSS